MKNIEYLHRIKVLIFLFYIKKNDLSDKLLTCLLKF